MSEKLTINLTKVGALLVIVLTLASVVGGGYIAYDNAKAAKKQSEDNHVKITVLETKQATFEGVIDERTRNMGNNIKDLKADMKLLLNKLELDDGQS